MPEKGSVEEWAPVFTRYFTDDQILNPSYLISRSGTGLPWCKVCDGPVHGDTDKHITKHRRELRAWRKRRQVAAEQKRLAGAAAKREEKRRMKEAGIE
jgi:hypothetical protein